MKFFKFIMYAVMPILLVGCGVSAGESPNPIKTPIYKKVNMDMNGIIIADAYIMQRKSMATGAFLKIVNTTNTDDILLGVKQDPTQPPLADRIEIHTTDVQNGTAKMYRVDSVPIPAQKMVAFENGSYHVMLMGLQRPVMPPTLYTLIFQFKNAGDIWVYVPAKSPRMIREDKNKPHDPNDGMAPQTRYDK